MDGERGRSGESTGERVVAQPKRPYRAPHLRRLGSVRELTLPSPGFTTVDNPITHTRRAGT